MKPTLFIADLHLSDHTPDLTALFIQFLRQHAPHTAALYILGDLFEAWTGDDDDSHTAHTVAQAIYQFSRHAPVYFLAGNRDFLLGKRYAMQAGMTLLPEHYLLTLHNHHILLTHGDELCTDDFDYLRYRLIIRQSMVQKMFLCLPFPTRKRIAEKLRATSRQRKQQCQDISITDATEEGVQDVCRRYRAIDMVIHGHTHRPNTHQHFMLTRTITRYVLPDWKNGQGGYLSVLPEQIEFHDLPEDSGSMQMASSSHQAALNTLPQD